MKNLSKATGLEMTEQVLREIGFAIHGAWRLYWNHRSLAS